MNTKQSIEWFLTTFAKSLNSTLLGAPFSQNLVAAIAFQETGYIWAKLVSGGKTAKEALKLCVGDSIDAKAGGGGRSAWPKTKADLLTHTKGAALFTVARRALEAAATVDAAYKKVLNNPNKFAHGYGIFQYDIQFFKSKNDSDFFLMEQWADEAECFKRLIMELHEAKARNGWASKTRLTPEEEVGIAIAYNAGRYNPAKGLKQGHKNDEGKFYGELVSAFYDIARSIPDDIGLSPGGGAGLNLTREEPFVPLVGTKKAPAYPGKRIKRDSADKASVKQIQQRLQDLGFTQPKAKGGTEPLAADGGFGENTEAAVSLFQTRHTDLQGLPLVMDGEVGSATWGALFGATTITILDGPRKSDGFHAKLLDLASLEVGVMEKPPGSNRGARVEEYLASVGLGKGFAWCVGFVYWCHDKVAKEMDVVNPMKKDCRTAGVLDLWNRAQNAAAAKVLKTEDAQDDPSKVEPGMLFIISTGGGNGHTGIVARVVGNVLETIEGNTNDGGSRDGIGVFRRTGRTIKSINRGFIRFEG